jgi:hypothetical protein
MNRLGRSIRGILSMGLLVVIAGIGCRDSISDKGFVGRWKRSDGLTHSELRFWNSPELQFCWSSETDASALTRCGADGKTEFVVAGEVGYEYQSSVRRTDDNRVLEVVVIGEPTTRGTPIRWVDRFELQPGGLKLQAFQIELNGKPREPPTGPRTYEKISDDPF